jgi:hypothetical protein
MNKSKACEGPRPDESKTMSVPKAGRIYFDLGRDASYQAAKNGQIPTIKIGGKIRAVVPAIERMLEQTDKTKPAA